MRLGIFSLLLSSLSFAFLIRSPAEMTRLRNALIFESDYASADLDEVVPSQKDSEDLTTYIPSDFPRIVDVDSDISANSTSLQKALAIAKHLTGGSPTLETPIQSDTNSAYRLIVEENLGYCSDYTQVFNALAVAAQVPVREWAMSFDGFSGDGHAFSEIYDFELRKWVFIDSFYSFYVVDPETNIPLSVTEFQSRIASGDVSLHDGIVPIDSAAYGFVSPQKTVEYYRRGVDQFYIWLDNNVFRYESNALVAFFSKFGRLVEQATAVTFGVHPKFQVYQTPDSDQWVDRLKSVRLLFGFAAIFGAGGLALVGMDIRGARNRRLRQ